MLTKKCISFFSFALSFPDIVKSNMTPYEFELLNSKTCKVLESSCQSHVFLNPNTGRSIDKTKMGLRFSNFLEIEITTDPQTHFGFSKWGQKRCIPVLRPFFYFQMKHPILFLPSVCSKKRFATSTYNILLLVGLPSWSSSDVFTSIIHLLHCIGNADWGLDLRLFWQLLLFFLPPCHITWRTEMMMMVVLVLSISFFFVNDDDLFQQM